MALNYKSRVRRNARLNPVTVVPSANFTVAATVSSTPIEIGDASTLRLTQAVTAHVGGTGTLDVKIQTGPTASGPWVEATANGATTAAFPQVVATDGSAYLIVTGLDRFVKAVIVKGGTTPNYTFSVSGEAV